MPEQTDTPIPTFSDAELAAWRGLLQVHATVTNELDAEMRAQHGISLSAYEVLIFLADAPEQRLRMSEIAQRTLLSRSGCTRLIDRLEELGYVNRHSVECDKRGLYAELTDAGREAVSKARRTHREGVRRVFFGRMNVSDQLVLGDIFGRFQAAQVVADAAE